MMQMLKSGDARDQFSKLQRDALMGKEILVGNGKQNDSPFISIISTQYLDAITETFIFSPEWLQDEDGSFTVSLDEIDVIGYGDTREEAIEVLATATIEYAELYFTDLQFYFSSMVNRGSHYPYLRRIARCNGSIDKVKQVLGT